MHVTVELLLMVARGELPPEALAEIAEEHVREVCPPCRREWEAASDPGEARRPGRVPHAPHPPLPDLAADDHAATLASQPECRRRLSAIRRERRRASRALDALLALPPEEWPARVAASLGAFHTRAFAELLLHESRERVRAEPALAGRLAELVPEVLRRLPTTAESWPLALAVRAEAHRANALRVAGDLPAADRAFTALRQRIADRAPREPAALGEIASLEASLRLDERRYHDAEELLGRALLLHRQAGDEKALRRTQVQLGMVLRGQGCPEEALVQLREGLRHLSPDGDEVLQVAAVNCTALCLCDLEDYEAAQCCLNEHRALYDRPADSPPIEAAQRATEGRIALGLGRPTKAAVDLVASRDAFLACDRAYDAALASLYLACAYLEAGETAELKRLAADLVPAFRARGVSREALAALGLLARAVAEERLTRATVDQIRRRLESTRAPAG